METSYCGFDQGLYEVMVSNGVTQWRQATVALIRDCMR